MGYKEYNLEWNIVAPGLLYGLTVTRSDGLLIGEVLIQKTQLSELEDIDALKRLIIKMEDLLNKGVEMSIVDCSPSPGKERLDA